MEYGMDRYAKRERKSALMLAVIFAVLTVLGCMALFLAHPLCFKCLTAMLLSGCIAISLYGFVMARQYCEYLRLKGGVLLRKRGGRLRKLTVTGLFRCKRHEIAFPARLNRSVWSRMDQDLDRYRLFCRQLLEVAEVAEELPETAVILRPVFPSAYIPALAATSVMWTLALLMLDCALCGLMPAISVLLCAGPALFTGGVLAASVSGKPFTYRLDLSASRPWTAFFQKLYPAYNFSSWHRKRSHHKTADMAGYLELRLSDGSRLIIDDRFVTHAEELIAYDEKAYGVLAENR